MKSDKQPIAVRLMEKLLRRRLIEDQYTPKAVDFSLEFDKRHLFPGIVLK